MESRDVNLHPDIDFLLYLHQSSYNGHGDVNATGGTAQDLNASCQDGWKKTSHQYDEQKVQSVNTTVVWE